MNLESWQEQSTRIIYHCGSQTQEGEGKKNGLASKVGNSQWEEKGKKEKGGQLS